MLKGGNKVDVNWLAVIVAAVINMAVGFAWYSNALFADPWMRALGKKREELGSPSSGYALTLVAALVQAVVLAKFVQYADATTFGAGMLVGFWAWLGFVATTHATNYIFEGKNRNLFTINMGYFLVVLLINGGLLAVWR